MYLKYGVCVLMVFVNSISSRKYDIEREAINLYGEDLESVLQNFRKTPEYLGIVNDELEDIRNQFGRTFVFVESYYRSQLKVRCEELINETATAGDDTAPAPSQDEASIDSTRLRYLPGIHFRRQMYPTEETPVQRLDRYEKLHSKLSVSDRNMFTNLGFEYAGKAIHHLIDLFERDDESEVIKSTQVGEDVTTTAHPTGHEVTTTTTTEAVTETTTEEALRKRKKKG